MSKMFLFMSKSASLKCYRYSIIEFELRHKHLPEKTHQEHKGALNYATDAWTSPNNKAYVAVTVHFEDKGVLVSMLLDIVEVPHSHSGVNLAMALAKILDDFGIKAKVRHC
jgi:hypothetical protein